MAFLTKIAELEDHRAKLEDGKALSTPSRPTPFAEGMYPPLMKPNKDRRLTRLICKAEDQEAAIKKLEEAESLARKNLTEAEKLESAAANDKKAAEKACRGEGRLVKLVPILPNAGRLVTSSSRWYCGHP